MDEIPYLETQAKLAKYEFQCSTLVIESQAYLQFI